MNTNLFNFITDEYIQAAPDAELSSSETKLLSALLSEEDQHDYYQLLETALSDDILHIVHQLTLLLHLSSSTTWTTIALLKKLIILQHSIDFLTIIACITLSSKYQDSSPQSIDYEFIAHCCHIQNIQLIHDAEIKLLDVLSYDICITTPDHFFSYLSNLLHNDHTLKQIVEQARSSFSLHSLSHQTFELLHNYPSSIVTLSLLYHITSNTFVAEQIKSFLLHKKDPAHYITQLSHCITQLQSATSSSLPHPFLSLSSW